MALPKATREFLKRSAEEFRLWHDGPTWAEQARDEAEKLCGWPTQVRLAELDFERRKMEPKEPIEKLKGRIEDALSAGGLRSCRACGIMLGPGGSCAHYPKLQDESTIAESGSGPQAGDVEKEDWPGIREEVVPCKLKRYRIDFDGGSYEFAADGVELDHILTQADRHGIKPRQIRITVQEL